MIMPKIMINILIRNPKPTPHVSVHAKKLICMPIIRNMMEIKPKRSNKYPTMLKIPLGSVMSSL